MSHLDGVEYGYDQINPYNQIPITFDYSDYGGKRILTAKDEVIPIKTPFPQVEASALHDGVKKTKEPFTDRIREDFSDIHILVLFLLILVVVMQIRIFTVLDTVIKLKSANISV